MGLTGNQCRNLPKVGTYANTQNQTRTQSNQNNSGVVPMEVDSATGQTNFKKLSPEERVQLAKEGRCFHCCLQGHMARDCPKNANRNTNSNARETTTNTKASDPPPTTNVPISKTPTTKLTRAQQICTLEEAMCYALTRRSSRWEVSLSGIGSGLSALATCDADVW